jgi:hypothetical protein
MADLTAVNVSCLFGKLAPEIRTLIYEYILSFDAPLKHVKDAALCQETHGSRAGV